MDSEFHIVENPIKLFKTMSESINEKKLCRFDLFVRLKANQVARYPNNSLTWCHRGDLYTQHEDVMLKNLIRMFLKRYAGYEIAILRDNSQPPNSPTRNILTFCKGVIEENRLRDYSSMLTKIHLPEWLA
jgi:hypothetical protein